MKKFLLFIIIAFGLLSSTAFAKDFNFTDTFSDIAKIHTDTVSATITLTKGGVANSRNISFVVTGKNKDGSDFEFDNPVIEFGSPRTAQTFTVSGLTAQTPYKFEFISDTTKQVFGFSTDSTTTTTALSDADVDTLVWLSSGDHVGFTGGVHLNIDTTGYRATLEVSPTTKFTNVITTKPQDAKEYDATQMPEGGPHGLAGDGHFYFQVPTTPKAIYYAREIIRTPNSPLVYIYPFQFSSTAGYTPEQAQSDAQNNFDAKSYHLLAPWPGLSVLMDPDLCAQEKADGKLAPGAICDINGFLNFAFKTLIGLTAVVLVLRLMYEGYQYMVTDVPFLKANAKGGFMAALWGLLLALSSYVILNTINPKLVENSIHIDQVNVGVDNFTFNGPREAYTTKNGKRTKIDTIKLKDMLPYAEKAYQATGVKTTTILGILWIETHFNSGDGSCYWKDSGVMPPDPGRSSNRDDESAFLRIMTSLNRSNEVNTQKVSCPLSSNTWGGAMGPSQHIPTYWESYTPRIEKATGRPYADPWDLQDAVLALAFHMADNGAVLDPENAACKYYSGHACGTKPQDSSTAGNLGYRDRFRSAVTSIEAELAITK